MNPNSLFSSLLLLLFVIPACPCHASASDVLAEVPESPPVRIFGNDTRHIPVRLSRPTAADQAPTRAMDFEIRTALYQMSSGSAAPVGSFPWKVVQILPGQTVLDTVPVPFPAVRAETRFLVRWTVGTNRCVGTADVFVYPGDLLNELKPLAADRPLGLLDPHNQLAPLLKDLRLEIINYAESALENHTVRLAVIGPFGTSWEVRHGLGERIKALASTGAAVVWIQPPQPPTTKLSPSFLIFRAGKGTVILAQSHLAKNLAESPQSQLNLIQLCRLALNPGPQPLPHFSNDT